MANILTGIIDRNRKAIATGQTVYAVEELNEQNEWTTLKVFTSRQAAEDEKQTLEAYGKKIKSN